MCNSLFQTFPCTSIRGFYLVARCSELLLLELISDSLNLIKEGGVGITTGGLKNFEKIKLRGDDYSVL